MLSDFAFSAMSKPTALANSILGLVSAPFEEAEASV